MKQKVTKKRMLSVYIIAEAKDNSESLCCLEKDWKDNPGLYQTSVNGYPMYIKRTIKAETWDEAMTKYHKIMGFEPYRPF